MNDIHSLYCDYEKKRNKKSRNIENLYTQNVTKQRIYSLKNG